MHDLASRPEMLNVSLRVCCSTSLPLRSVMPEEMLRVMAARCEFELEDGVWYLLDGPPELLQLARRRPLRSQLRFVSVLTKFLSRREFPMSLEAPGHQIST